MVRGKRLEREIRRAMGASDITSLTELSRQSRVQRDTLYAWFRGERPPKPDTLQKVADALEVRLGSLWDYGPVAEPVVTDLAGELHAWRTESRVATDELLGQVGAIRALLESWIGAGGAAPGTALAPRQSSHPGR